MRGWQTTSRILVIGTLAAIAVPGAALAQRPTISNDFKTCVGKDSGDRIAACTRAIDSGKHRATDLAALYTVRGMAAFGAGRVDDAIADQSRAIRLAPKDPLGYFSRAYIYRAKGDDSRALADFTQAIVHGRKLPLARNFRGNIYLDKGDYNRAIVDYTEAIKLRPTLASAHASRGHARRAKGEHDRAIAD